MPSQDPVASAVERELWGEPTLSGREVAARVEMDLELLRELSRALGVSLADPDEPAFFEADVEAATRIKAMLDAGVPQEALMGVARVLGHGMARWAESVRDMWVEAFTEPGTPPEESAQRLGQMAKVFLPEATRLLEYTFQIHLREVLRHEAAGLDAHTKGGGRNVTVAVGFADIVGFTALGEELTGEEMGAIAHRIAERAGALATDGVRLVKTIGDGVMLVAPDPEPLLGVLLELVEGGEGPPVRAGLAFGPALHRLGDYYGHTVNLASRVTDRARPGTVLATREVRDSAGEGFEFSDAGPKRLKGVGTVGLYRARRTAS